jgi:hypothetical protein
VNAGFAEKVSMNIWPPNSSILQIFATDVRLHLSAKSIQAQSISLNTKEHQMATINESIAELLKIDGAMAVALVDSSTGMVMGKGGSGINLDAAGAGNTEVIRAKMKTMKALGINESIEDILITLGSQFHIIRPMASKPTVFVYLVLDKNKANLGMARFKVMEIEKALAF